MPVALQKLYADLRSRAEALALRVTEEPLPLETAGKFDSRSVTMNSAYDLEARCFYLVHAVGSIARWCEQPEESKDVFIELRTARKHRQADPGRLERALVPYRAFEEAASEHAVWLLADLGYGEIIPRYTNFARADLEALTAFHRSGVAPVWRDFFAAWNARVQRGEQPVPPYQPKPVPPLRPVRMHQQEVLQEIDGKP
jgi:hypothetical protein